MQRNDNDDVKNHHDGFADLRSEGVKETILPPPKIHFEKQLVNNKYKESHNPSQFFPNEAQSRRKKTEDVESSKLLSTSLQCLNSGSTRTSVDNNPNRNLTKPNRSLSSSNITSITENFSEKDLQVLFTSLKALTMKKENVKVKRQAIFILGGSSEEEESAVEISTPGVEVLYYTTIRIVIFLFLYKYSNIMLESLFIIIYLFMK